MSPTTALGELDRLALNDDLALAQVRPAAVPYHAGRTPPRERADRRFGGSAEQPAVSVGLGTHGDLATSVRGALQDAHCVLSSFSRVQLAS